MEVYTEEIIIAKDNSGRLYRGFGNRWEIWAKTEEPNSHSHFLPVSERQQSQGFEAIA